MSMPISYHTLQLDFTRCMAEQRWDQVLAMLAPYNRTPVIQTFKMSDFRYMGQFLNIVLDAIASALMRSPHNADDRIILGQCLQIVGQLQRAMADEYARRTYVNPSFQLCL